MRLRPVVAADLTTIYRLTSDPEATGEHEWFGWQDRWSYRRRWEATGLLDDDGGVLMVERQSEMLGFVAWSKRQTARTSWYLFMHTQVNRIEAGTEVTNLAEQRALEKAGFTREGVMRGAAFQGGRWRDGAVYSVLRSEVEL